MRRLSSIALAVTAALALLLAVLGILNADRLLSGRAGDDEARAYLPFALASPPTSPGRQLQLLRIRVRHGLVFRGDHTEHRWQ